MTDRKITPFLFDGEITLRVIEQDTELWFVAIDACRALELSNPSEAVRVLDEDEKGISATDILGGHQEVVVVSESGLYALIFKSRKPNARRFWKWVTSEVLPAIRKRRTHSSPAWPNHFEATATPKPWPEWSLEERRVAVSEVNTLRRVQNQAAAAWLWRHLGLPTPPRHLLHVWWQSEILTTKDLPAN